MTIEKSLQKADVIVLEADGKIDPQHGYGHLIVKRLAEFNINAIIISIVENTQTLEKLPPKPLILSGGMTEVTADVDWLNKTREFITGKIKANQKLEKEKRTPIFGICFGAQLLAECYSKGSVKYLDDPEIGITKVNIGSPHHPIFNGYKEDFNAYTFHYNQIKTQDVSTISSHQHKNHHFIQAFEIPNASCYGIQFHPEFNYKEFITLLHTYKQLLKDLGLNAENIIKNLPKIQQNSIILKNFIDLTKKEAKMEK